MGDILAFPESEHPARLDCFLSSYADVNDLAADLGNRSQWIDSAITYLKLATSGRTDGTARVSIAALHLVLDHVEQLEVRLGIIPAPGGAA